ncbi:MAG: SWIM zinc finger family protein [Pseudomonadota bacterium]
MTAVDQTFRYTGASALRTGRDATSLALVGEADGTDAPVFLRARARDPFVTARGLRAVTEIVGSRFYVPPAMVARILREADPVVTVGAETLRFEGFSACCSAFARLDLSSEALDVDARSKGTTNVDFGPELRAALASVGRDATLDLTVGADAVTLARDGRHYVERKVPLPLRWIKGFGEVQVAMAGMEPAFVLRGVVAQRFLRSLPRSKSDHLQWLTMAGDSLRAAARENRGAVPLRGAHRLRVLEPLIGLADTLAVHVNRATGATGWIAHIGAQRFCLVLNQDPWRGFSGDGGLLSRAHGASEAAVARVRAQLHWQDRIEPRALAETTGLEENEARDALAHLAALGLVGFDLSDGAYFHRVLPFGGKSLQALNPRLKAAEALVGHVRRVEGGAELDSDGATHRITQTETGWRCTCPWFARYGGRRGPCKHVLATEMVMEHWA